MGIILIPIGVVCLDYGLMAQEVSQRYDDTCLQLPAGSNGTTAAMQEELWQPSNQYSTNGSCNVSLTITARMEPPIFIYYELDGFYQNHRRYVKSRVDQQLAGQNLGSSALSVCAPELNFQGNSSAVINPCGLIAWSNFNDTYTMTRSTNGGAPQPLTVSDKGIAYPSDLENRFADYNASFFNINGSSQRVGGSNLSAVLPDGQLGAPLAVNQNERFVVWMRLAALPKFRKLYGRIDDTTLQPGDVVTVRVFNRYNTYAFNGKKSIVLGTTTWLGGRNPFLGIVFIVTGGVSVLLAIVYLVLKSIYPRNFADISDLGEIKPQRSTR